jgi:lipopolysaccharide transport system ATP-binding protein
MSSDIAVRAEGLAKAYTIRHQPHDHVTLAQVALDRLRHPMRRMRREQFWALRDVAFEVGRGEVMGVIGRNGAGKSTLLKLLSRITAPTAGRIDLWGRVGSLLEVGTGFHPELTGRENVYLNGSILGMRRREIDAQFAEIVDFAGVERFLDTPVKRYSSGMYVRLAFAVAAHLQSEILVVDEVLAVGDAAFQQKCLGKLHDVAAGGRTVFFVSHQLGSVASLCHRALVMDRGSVAFAGPTREAIERYQQELLFVPDVADAATARPDGGGPLRLANATVEPAASRPHDQRAIHLTLEPAAPGLAPYFLVCRVFDDEGRVVVLLDTRLHGSWLDPARPQRVRLTLRHPWLLPGRYRVDVRAASGSVLNAWEWAASFHVSEELPYPGFANPESMSRSLVLADFSVDVDEDEDVLGDDDSEDRRNGPG